MERSIERRLAAILSADVKGYSRLMREDELATVDTLTAYRKVVDESGSPVRSPRTGGGGPGGRRGGASSPSEVLG